MISLGFSVGDTSFSFLKAALAHRKLSSDCAVPLSSTQRLVSTFCFSFTAANFTVSVLFRRSCQHHTQKQFSNSNPNPFTDQHNFFIKNWPFSSYWTQSSEVVVVVSRSEGDFENGDTQKVEMWDTHPLVDSHPRCASSESDYRISNSQHSWI